MGGADGHMPRRGQQVSAALELAVARFRSDPEMARYATTEDVGGCWNTAHRFAWYLHEESVPYTFRKWRNLPGLRTEYQHNLEVDGNIVCWTHRQIDPEAAWPHVEPVAVYQARGFEPLPVCVTCGSSGAPHRCRGLERMEALLQRLTDELAAQFAGRSC